MKLSERLEEEMEPLIVTRVMEIARLLPFVVLQLLINSTYSVELFLVRTLQVFLMMLRLIQRKLDSLLIVRQRL